MASTTSERLSLLQEHIRFSLLSRARALKTGADPSSNTFEISRSLDTLHQGIEQLEREQRHLENAGQLYFPLPPPPPPFRLTPKAQPTSSASAKTFSSTSARSTTTSPRNSHTPSPPPPPPPPHRAARTPSTLPPPETH